MHSHGEERIQQAEERSCSFARSVRFDSIELSSDISLVNIRKQHPCVAKKEINQSISLIQRRKSV